MHPRTLLLAPLLACTALAAQTPQAVAPLLQEQPRPEGRMNQKVEFIHHEDGLAVIDEVRYGGQTQSIRVQPRGDVPAYEIQPADMARTRPTDPRDGIGGATGQRVWNVFRF